MNTLAALKKEIEKKRKQASTTLGHSASEGRPAKRWRSQAELETERRNAYLAQEIKDVERRRTESEKRRKESSTYLLQHGRTNEGSGDTRRHSSSQHPVKKRTSAEAGDDPERHKDPPLSKEEVIARLRSLKEPATLFGEESWDRFNRMRDLELAREELSKGQKNVFQEKMREIEAKDAEDDVYRYTGAKLPALNTNTNGKKDEEDGNAESAPACKEDYVYLQLRKYLRLWSSEIDAMSKEERRTNKGRSLVVTYEQTKDWLKPLNKLLRKKKVPKKILDGLQRIFEAAAQREYVQAYSLYLEQLAIGKAPWPMGATMVGIHARAAREKIGEDKIAHVMNDEQTRKYIQGVKRLLTVAQRHFPTSPSKMIL